MFVFFVGVLFCMVCLRFWCYLCMILVLFETEPVFMVCLVLNLNGA